ncbi:phosphoribosylformylglycinamidine cyclo-ligase [Desulfotalea psychrophila]|uniref:Phosphoribosylformylglycinamidine cyclo-ligase n=1 Tax=Desulfotalea psychrophila (strain LSv54 / DSM 12343) TaxID=177439 RepID=PUR5_DESPS|nr:phosphoribosylformylglycinamidine cyclo-ligase [Desulfotalea psychrophila]Q6AK63.1 RecName: Full=Phosphoribosylformylglycinamidine cyclo-ligase; AltName: Full=AIR synthase; AltName: Full=AIRS; AltName: Full=Phosphoribosyl-aminoimidazole synthetase [Desulfotalea psychrophila LSv54]CAG37263.1 probable phosphoribosyl-formylglycinamidine cyclo-ligase [Desulfotalea psychrophila LSv54]
MSTTSEAVQSKYSEAGVDIDKGNAFVEGIKDIVASTHKNGVIDNIGGFSAHIAIDVTKYPKPVIVNSTDGVGTKLAIAHMCNKHDTIGIDLVAMCVNDLIVGGATPLSFLDYFAVGKLDIEVATEVVKGIAEGCKQAGCSLVGGETAEMPGLYQGSDYDLAGFVTGIVDRDSIIDGSDVRSGNKIIGLASSGVHSNGYSLVRKICFDDNDYSVEDHIEELGSTLGEELLKPTRIYVQQVLNVIKNYPIHGMVHNTGGGFIDNIPRILPKGYKATLQAGSWDVPAIFTFLEEKGKVPREEMYRTFNMGVGLLVIVAEDKAEDILHHFEALGEKASIIGEIQKQTDENDERVTILPEG